MKLRLDRQHAEASFNFRREKVVLHSGGLGVDPIQAKFINLQIRIVDEEWLGENSRSVTAALVEYLKESVARIDLGRCGGGGSIRKPRARRRAGEE